MLPLLLADAGPGEGGRSWPTASSSSRTSARACRLTTIASTASSPASSTTSRGRSRRCASSCGLLAWRPRARVRLAAAAAAGARPDLQPLPDHRAVRPLVHRGRLADAVPARLQPLNASQYAIVICGTKAAGTPAPRRQVAETSPASRLRRLAYLPLAVARFAVAIAAFSSGRCRYQRGDGYAGCSSRRRRRDHGLSYGGCMRVARSGDARVSREGRPGACGGSARRCSPPLAAPSLRLSRLPSAARGARPRAGRRVVCVARLMLRARPLMHA